MSKLYDKEVLDKLAERKFPVIVVFTDNDVAIGYFEEYNSCRRHYYLRPLSINIGGTCFNRGHIKQIVYLSNGLILPKLSGGRQKLLDIIELNDLVNKTKYEFI